jgi:hypothetical protein
MEIIKRLIARVPPLSLQEEFAPGRGASQSTGVVRRAVTELVEGSMSYFNRF